MSTFPFKAEYAKSDRSSCKKCRQTIGKGSLRLAVMVQSPFFDGKVPNWYHYPCFWRVATVTIPTEIAGFDGLRWDDQQKIKKKVEGDVAGETLADKVVVKKTTPNDYSVEYAKSNRSTCQICFKKIAKAEMRIAFLVKNDDNDNDDDNEPSVYQTWHHVDCFCDPVRMFERGWQNDYQVTKISGFLKLKKPDQELLKKKLVVKEEPKKRKPESQGGTAAKKAKKESKEDTAMREQSQFLWKIRDQLSRYVSNKGLKDLLEENNQVPLKGESALLEAVADGMAFGALERCPECKGGQLAVRSDSYHCTGNLTSWTKCLYSSKDPKKKPWTISEDFKDIKCLREFKFKPFNKGVRVFSEAPPTPSTSAAVAGPPPDKPLQDVKVALIGKLTKTNKDMTKEVETLGGTVVTKVDSNVACCISNQAEVKKMAKKMKDAKAADVHIVSEDFLENVKKGGAALMINKHSIATWGGDPSSRLGGFTQIDAAQSKQDADELKYKKGVDKLKMKVKGGAAVDPDSGVQDRTHVYSAGDLKFNATLGMVDIMKGTNSFYKIQLLESDSKSSSNIYLFRAWGRVGTTIGGNKLTTFKDMDEAVEQFKFVYKEKTGNDFGAKEFKKHANKFYPLEIDYGEDDQEEVQSLKSGTGSKLPASVQDLIVMIFDIDNMKKTMVEFEIDLKKMPLGKLSKRQIESAYSVLSEAQKLLEKGGEIKTAILDCSNRFYTLIPHDFGLKKPPMLDDLELIKSKTQMLDNLLDIEVAYSLLKGGSEKGKDPVDANYEKLQCKIKPVVKEGKDFQMVEQFISNSNDAKGSLDLKVLDVFEVDRSGEAKKFKKGLHNRRLLWHGSRVSNFAGILSQGLRIAPPEAPVSGYLYGKGVYFADMVAKSMWYCRTSSTNNIGIMLLCDVALGDMYEIPHTEYMEKPPAGKDSTRGIGRVEPNPSQSLKKDGYVVPYGKPKNTGKGRSYNEFIVYDISQIQMKYLIKIDFQHKY
ncbi:poly [ADP-ribose] polymerase 1-like [Glandiceps talaboti]